MANRLYTSFVTRYGSVYDIYIDDSEYSDPAVEVTMVEAGLSASWEGAQDDPFFPIIGSSVKIEIATDSAVLADIESFDTALQAAEEGRFTIKIEKDSNVWWVGYVLPDLSRFSDTANVYVYTVTGTDGLGRLKDIDYSYTTPNPDTPFGNQTFIEILTYCLNQGTVPALYYVSSDIFLRTVVNWQDSNLGAPAANNCPLERSVVDGAIWAKATDEQGNPWDFMSCFDVLKSVCEGWGARIYYANGSFRFEQIRERAQDTLYERRFDLDGVFVSGTASAGYDLEITRTGRKHRLAGGSFGYLSAIKKVTVEYAHNTLRNYADGQDFHYNNTNDNSFTIGNFGSSSDSFLRISGTLYFSATITAYTEPWRYVVGLRIKRDTQEVQSLTSSVIDGSGNYTLSIKRTTPAWVAGPSKYYEITTPYSTGATNYANVSFVLDTPTPLPSGSDVYIEIVEINARKKDGTTLSPTYSTFYWTVPDLNVQVLDSADPTVYLERVRTYHADNATTGNSKDYKIKAKFGHSVRAWTPTKLITAGVNTDITWDYGTGTDNLQFGELLATEIMRLRAEPTITYQGSFIGTENLDFHRRIIMQPDNIAFLPFRATFNPFDAILEGEWFKAGINLGAFIVRKLDKSIVPIFGTTSFPPGLVKIPGSTNPVASGGGGLTNNLALTALTTNYISTTITAGSVTTIDLDFPVAANAYLQNDDIYLVDPYSGQITPLTVSTTASAGDTTLSVSGTAVEDIPLGSYVIYSPLNHYTNQGGGGGGTGLPSGTNKYTLRHNGTSWVASDLLQNDGTTVAVGQAPDSSYLFSVKQTGASSSTNGIGVVRSGSTNVAAIYHNGSATFESVGGNNLQLKTASGSIINLVPGGGGGQIGQVTIAPGANVTTVLGGSAMIRISGTYAPTASGGDFSLFHLQTTFNQTSSADQILRGLNINPTFTAVLTEFRGVAYQPSTQIFLYQPNGTSVKSHIIGNIGIGTGTTTPAAKIDVVGNGATSATHSLLVSNSTPAIVLAVRDDKRVGVLTSSPAVSLDAIAATDSIGLPTGTTAQRPSVNSSIRLNSTVAGVEVRNGGAWHRLTCAVQPTIAAGAAAGTGPTVSVTLGNDLCHAISITTGTSCTTGTLCTVTFNQALDAGLFTCVVFSPTNTGAATEIAKFYVGSTGNTSYTIACATAPTDATDYTFNILVKQ